MKIIEAKHALDLYIRLSGIWKRYKRRCAIAAEKERKRKEAEEAIKLL